MAASSSVLSSESATARDADTKRKKSVHHSKKNRVAALSPHDRLEVTRSLQIREKGCCMGVECLIASGDPEKRRDYLESELQKARFLLGKAAEEEELVNMKRPAALTAWLTQRGVPLGDEDV